MNFLQKATSLIFEVTPDDEATSHKSKNDKTVAGDDDALARLERQAVDVDKLLQEQGLGVKKPSPTNTGSAPIETKTAEQITKDAPGPDLNDVKVTMPISTGQPGAPLQPSAIYEAAKLPPSPFTAEQMLKMLAGLPTELPLDIKRQTIKVTLGALGKTMGATPETIVADASRKMAALKSYVEYLQKRTDEFAKNGDAEIAALQKQIEDKRKAIDNARGSLKSATQLCVKESERLDDVLEFFSLDVAPSKYAPKANTE